ncbi:MAG TPA: peptidoglycan DD-metalloendopeptidase family protein [Polyangiaceae bacterium]|nr:peptidoglycan DD-metalloendopeptidase family protein [Polyangiaceae bacterium]
MSRRSIAAMIFAVAVPVVAIGHAAPGGPGPSRATDPILALASLDRRIADLDAEEQSDKAELSRLAAPIAATHARVLARGKAYYKLTRAGLLPVGGGFSKLVTYAMHVERARRVLTADIDEEGRLRQRATDIGSELGRVARDRLALASQRTAMDSARVAMEDERRRQVAFDRAFQTSTGAAADYVAVYGGAGVVAPDTPGGGFAASRGRLLFPVVGRADVRPAHRDGTEGPGLEVHAPTGSAVRAVFAGRVAFADRYGPYGRIVILDHGDHFYTVSGDLDEIDVKIGQDVGAGERIGTVGDDGQGSMLYFEVRHGSQTVPPGPWLGL